MAFGHECVIKEVVMKIKEVASIVVFLFVAFSWLMIEVNHSEQDKIEQLVNIEGQGMVHYR